MQINPPWYHPPPVWGTWGEEAKKKMKFWDVPLSNIDLTNWCKYLGIPIRGIFSTDEVKPLHHSPCILNLDDFGSLGNTGSLAGRGKTWNISFSFGQPPPAEWEQEMWKAGNESFLRSNNQIQAIDSVRCASYCLLFLNERN